MQGNLLGYLYVNPSARYINAAAYRAFDVSALVKPGKANWLVRRDLPIEVSHISQRFVGAQHA